MGRAGAARACLPAVLVAGLMVTGCDASAPGGRAGSTPPSPRTASDEELCVRLVGYWSREALEGDGYGDYQSMGLSNGQYDILRAAVAAARPVERRQGMQAARELLDRQVRTGCAGRYRGGGPTGGPWQ
ncbi:MULTISPECIES: hypothetical protein [Streptomyces]|uniref:Lipoprotein n=1 Tax=Streptomyces edwardsiae TaxID=3075527 RepID=A0ABU2QI52_9ACTN|nr:MULTISPECIES: hypothetical protein [unclassified Streptomyces]MDT0403666.1 hypothetical protein [Streptomyces sp. DSM 41635]